jgi:hypothetical protein
VLHSKAVPERVETRFCLAQYRARSGAPGGIAAVGLDFGWRDQLHFQLASQRLLLERAHPNQDVSILLVLRIARAT